MKITITLFFTTLIASISQAQFSTSIIDYNNVSALVSDGGVLFNDAAIGAAGYEIPKGNGTHAIYAAGFWFGGEDAGSQLRTCASHYMNAEDIFPGPIANPGEYTSASYLADYTTSIWSVSLAEVNNHMANWNQPWYTAPSSILNWPGSGDVSIGVAAELAPFADVNSNNIYEPLLGDYPNIRGDYATYIIMNDAAQAHTGTLTPALGIEVHLMIYQYATTNVMNDVTFINTKVYNRGTETYNDFKTSFFIDGDIGNYADDYYGCDSIRNIAYAYNGDNLDEDNAGLFGYGANIPSVGMVSLSQPISGAGYFTNAGTFPTNDPTDAASYWNYMHNMWADGTPWVYGGTGFPGSPGATNSPTNFLLGGDPTNSAEWSELSSDFAGTANTSGDRRMFMNLPGTILAPGDKYCYDFAAVFGQDTSTFMGSIMDMKLKADSVQTFFDAQNFSCDEVVLGNSELVLSEFDVFPNPSNGEFTIQFEQSIGEIQIQITDMAGRLVNHSSQKNYNDVKVKIDSVPGVYLLSIEENGSRSTQRIIIK